MELNSDLYKEGIEKISELNLFDSDYYNECNPDVKKANVNPFEHYLKIGYKEGRNPSKSFDTTFYINEYLNNKLDINPLIHYALYGADKNLPINSEKIYDSNLFNSNDCSDDIFLTKYHINLLSKKDSYYNVRWKYYNEVIQILKRLSIGGETVHNKKILELGPYKSPLIEGSDVMDITNDYVSDYPLRCNNFYEHDCSKIPYPVKDKYDLIVACQVLEHLGIYGEQKNIFNEFERISDMALISLPYKWFSPSMRDHHMIDEKVIDYWADGRVPVFSKIVDKRIIRIYRFNE